MSKHTANQPHEHAEQHISHKACDALRLLALDGWSITRLKITFKYTSTDSIEYHAYNMCSHNNKVCSAGMRYSKQKKNTVQTLKRYIRTNPANHNLSDLECNATSILYATGWTYRELQQVFELTSGRLAQHIRKHCTHRNLLNIEWTNQRERVLQYTPEPALTIPE